MLDGGEFRATDCTAPTSHIANAIFPIALHGAQRRRFATARAIVAELRQRRLFPATHQFPRGGVEVRQSGGVADLRFGTR